MFLLCHSLSISFVPNTLSRLRSAASFFTNLSRHSKDFIASTKVGSSAMSLTAPDDVSKEIFATESSVKESSTRVALSCKTESIISASVKTTLVSQAGLLWLSYTWSFSHSWISSSVVLVPVSESMATTSAFVSSSKSSGVSEFYTYSGNWSKSFFHEFSMVLCEISSHANQCSAAEISSWDGPQT